MLFGPYLTLSLAGCGTATLGLSAIDTSDTAIVSSEPVPYDGPLALDTIALPGCDEGTWVYHATTVGWSNGQNLVNAWEVGLPIDIQYNEEHPFPSVNYGPANAWDELELRLDTQATLANQTAGVNTTYSCETHDQGGLNVYAIRVYDVDNNLADCAVFADGVDGGVAAILDATAEEINPVTARDEELNRENCTEWVVDP